MGPYCAGYIVTVKKIGSYFDYQKHPLPDGFIPIKSVLCGTHELERRTLFTWRDSGDRHTHERKLHSTEGKKNFFINLSFKKS